MTVNARPTRTPTAINATAASGRHGVDIAFVIGGARRVGQERANIARQAPGSCRSVHDAQCASDEAARRRSGFRAPPRRRHGGASAVRCVNDIDAVASARKPRDVLREAVGLVGVVDDDDTVERWRAPGIAQTRSRTNIRSIGAHRHACATGHVSIVRRRSRPTTGSRDARAQVRFARERSPDVLRASHGGDKLNIATNQ